MGLIILPGRENEHDEDLPPAPRELDHDSLKRWAFAVHKGYIGDVTAFPETERSLHWAIGRQICEGDPRIAVLILIGLVAAREGADQDALGSLLGDAAWSVEANGVVVRRCRVCGCSNTFACEVGCWWIEWDLCSACEHAAGAERKAEA